MDLKLFLIMAVILIGIFKEVKKASKSASTGHPSPDSPNPLPNATEESPMPEAWNFPKPFEHVPIPTPLKRNTQEAFPADTETESPVVQRRKNKKNRAQHAIQRNESPKRCINPLHRLLKCRQLQTQKRPATKKTSKFARPKKQEKPLSGEKYFSGNTKTTLLQAAYCINSSRFLEPLIL